MKNDKVNIFGVFYNPTTYSDAVNAIISKAQNKVSYGVSALAVHGLIECYRNNILKEKVHKIHYVVPDGQPIRWVLNSFYDTNLKDRVYGPTLTLKVLEKANEHGLKVYLYGSTERTLQLFESFITNRFLNIIIVGIHVDRFREASIEEDFEDITKNK